MCFVKRFGGRLVGRSGLNPPPSSATIFADAVLLSGGGGSIRFGASILFTLFLLLFALLSTVLLLLVITCGGRLRCGRRRSGGGVGWNRAAHASVERGLFVPTVRCWVFLGFRGNHGRVLLVGVWWRGALDLVVRRSVAVRGFRGFWWFVGCRRRSGIWFGGRRLCFAAIYRRCDRGGLRRGTASCTRFGWRCGGRHRSWSGLGGTLPMVLLLLLRVVVNTSDVCTIYRQW